MDLAIIVKSFFYLWYAAIMWSIIVIIIKMCTKMIIAMVCFGVSVHIFFCVCICSWRKAGHIYI